MAITSLFDFLHVIKPTKEEVMQNESLIMNALEDARLDTMAKLAMKERNLQKRFPTLPNIPIAIREYKVMLQGVPEDLSVSDAAYICNIIMAYANRPSVTTAPTSVSDSINDL